MTMTTQRPAAPTAHASAPAPARRRPWRPAPRRTRSARRPVAPAPADDMWSVISTTSLMCCLVAGWMVAQMLYLGGLSQDRAQDAVQEALLEALRVWPEHPPRDLAGWLATVATPSPTRLVFTLRPGITFWDGHPVTPADVVYSLDRSTDTARGANAKACAI